MIGLSRPLWVAGSDFPRVPFVANWPEGPAWVSSALLVGIFATVGWAAAGPGWRVALSAGLVLMAVEVLEDQSRLQPWAYQFLVVGLVLVLAPGPPGLGLARVYAITLYAYSGLSKLDISFVSELGPTFLTASLAPLGISPAGWPAGLRTAAILAMPAWEVAVASGLCFAKTRRLALLGAVAQHSALIAILGPGGLGHSVNVLVWNGAMIAEGWLLFWPDPISASEPARWSVRVATVLIGLVAAWPLGERMGYCDSWPGHALYASHAERAEIYVHDEEADRFPLPMQYRLGPADFRGWRRLDLTGWSRDVRGVPIYPQARVGLGVARALAELPGGTYPIRVSLWDRANLWNGLRERFECIGRAAMAEKARRFFINTRPSRNLPRSRAVTSPEPERW